MSDFTAYPTVEDDFSVCERDVVRPWLCDLTYKQQTVLLSAIRGCDGAGKEDLSKKFVRAYRSVLLFNAAPGAGQFMHPSIQVEDIEKFLNSLDHYPMHWLMHFTHAVEIVGYNHPQKDIRNWWYNLYLGIVSALHLLPESFSENNARLQDGTSRDCWKT